MTASLWNRRRIAQLPIWGLLFGAAATSFNSASKGQAMTDTSTPRKSPFGDIAPALGDYTCCSATSGSARNFRRGIVASSP
jgi:hypothetical protein